MRKYFISFVAILLFSVSGSLFMNDYSEVNISPLEDEQPSPPWLVE